MHFDFLTFPHRILRSNGIRSWTKYSIKFSSMQAMRLGACTSVKLIADLSNPSKIADIANSALVRFIRSTDGK